MKVAADVRPYLARIGLPEAPPVSLSGLARIQDAHLRSIAFENFDVLLGRGVNTEPEAIYEKIVLRGRGGYCFETNTLLAEMLTALGFQARVVLGRVVFGAGGIVPARLHALVLVELDWAKYVVDAGFGGHTMRGVMAVRHGAHVDWKGRGWRLLEDEELGWRLSDRTPEGWRDLYTFDLGRVYPMDVRVANYWTSVFPTSPFLANPLVARHTEEGRLSLLGRQFTRHSATQQEPRPLASLREFREVVLNDLEIPLEATQAEWQALWDRSTLPEQKPG